MILHTTYTGLRQDDFNVRGQAGLHRLRPGLHARLRQRPPAVLDAVRARPRRLSPLSVSRSKSGFCGAFAWACGALNISKTAVADPGSFDSTMTLVAMLLGDFDNTARPLLWPPSAQSRQLRNVFINP